MTEWTLLWGAAAVIASVIIARWYGQSWRAVAEALGAAAAQRFPPTRKCGPRSGEDDLMGTQ